MRNCGRRSGAIVTSHHPGRFEPFADQSQDHTIAYPSLEVHPDLRHDARAHIALLSPEQWEEGEVVQDPQGGVHSGEDPAEPGRRTTSRGGFHWHYNQVRLHSAIGYVVPADKLAGRETVIFAERDRKLNATRERRRVAREAARAAV